MRELIAGIDLGTSTSAIGYFTEVKGHAHGRVDLVQGELGVNWFYSSVLFDMPKDTWIVGRAARGMYRAVGRAPYYVVSAKRHLGINRTIALNGSSTLTSGGKTIEITPQYLLSKVLQHLKTQAEKRAPEFVLKKVVVAIPMVYMSHEASLTKEAVELAGMELLDFIQEPTAAALYYVHDNPDMNELKEGEKILVFDLGGGTFDITVFQLNRKARDELSLDVLATEGVRQLGGDDVNEILLEYLRSQGLKLPDPIPPDLRGEIMERIESDVKVPLSNATEEDAESYININRGSITFGREFTRAEFVRVLTKSTFAKQLENACQRVYEQIGPVVRVMMVGGSSHLPICKPIIQKYFGEKVKINSALNVQEAVVRGAVYRAAQLNGRPTGRRKITLRNHGILSHDFGVLYGEAGSERFSVLIPKGTPYPMAVPKEQRYRIAKAMDGPLVIECAQGDGKSAFVRGTSPHQIFGEVNHGILPAGPITVKFRANEFGEIIFTSEWTGDSKAPLVLRPSFKHCAGSA